MPKLRRNNNLAMLKMPELRTILPLPKLQFYWSIEAKNMAKVVVSLKIFPSDISVDLNVLKTKIEKSLPKYASVHKFVEEPIAYGLVALIAHIVVPEETSGGIDEVEKVLKGMAEISEMETLMVRRV